MQCRKGCRVVAAESPASSRVANDTPQKRNRPSSPEQMKRTTETHSGGLLVHLWCSAEMERKGFAQLDVVFPSYREPRECGSFYRQAEGGRPGAEQKGRDSLRWRRQKRTGVTRNRNSSQSRPWSLELWELPETPLNQNHEGRSYQKLLSIKTMKAWDAKLKASPAHPFARSLPACLATPRHAVSRLNSHMVQNKLMHT